MRMIKYNDITGQVFADLTALNYVRSDKFGMAIWLFRCICSNEIEYVSRQVVRGENLSCGCRRSRNCQTPKICIHCGEMSDRRNRHGNLASVCRKCNDKQTNGFKLRNPKFQLMRNARVRHKKQGVPFTITEADFEIPELCPILGMKLEPGTSEFHDYAPSLDKIVPHLGYVPGNVAVISHLANQIKNCGSAEDHRKIYEWMVKHQPQGYIPPQKTKVYKPKAEYVHVTSKIFSEEHRANLSKAATARWVKKHAERELVAA